MIQAHIIKTLGFWVKVLFIGFTVAVCACIVVVTWFLSQPKGTLTCESFGSYDQMYQAYNAGALNLDRDHDGCPCEARFPHQCRYGE